MVAPRGVTKSEAVQKHLALVHGKRLGAGVDKTDMSNNFEIYWKGSSMLQLSSTLDVELEKFYLCTSWKLLSTGAQDPMPSSKGSKNRLRWIDMANVRGTQQLLLSQWLYSLFLPIWRMWIHVKVERIRLLIIEPVDCFHSIPWKFSKQRLSIAARNALTLMILATASVVRRRDGHTERHGKQRTNPWGLLDPCSVNEPAGKNMSCLTLKIHTLLKFVILFIL
jgi:hypothetical protein